MKNSIGKALSYLKGLVLVYMATLIFLALGWVKVGGNWELNKLTVTALAAFIIWTFIFVLYDVIWSLAAILTGCTMGFGFILALWGIGYMSLKLVVFLLPAGWIVFSGDEYVWLGIGAVYGLISGETRYEERVPKKLKKNSRKKWKNKS